MTLTELQQWLNIHGQTLAVDGAGGPLTRAAIVAAFTNPCAKAISEEAIAALAARLNCTVKQLRAVSAVESGGSGFDQMGRPKILFERHLFHRMTDGVYSPTIFSDPAGGGYAQDSWEKLTLAACKDPSCAFASASWGRFQVLGAHWRALGYPSSLEMAYSAVTGEAAHFEMLVRFIEANRLKPALQNISRNPADNIDFASRYNGPSFRNFDYHLKLARAMG